MIPTYLLLLLLLYQHHCYLWFLHVPRPYKKRYVFLGFGVLQEYHISKFNIGWFSLFNNIDCIELMRLCILPRICPPCFSSELVLLLSFQGSSSGYVQEYLLSFAFNHLCKVYHECIICHFLSTAKWNMKL